MSKLFATGSDVPDPNKPQPDPQRKPKPTNGEVETFDPKKVK